MTVEDAISAIENDTTIRFGYLYGDSLESAFGVNIAFEAMRYSSIFYPFYDLTVKRIAPVDNKTIEIWVNKYDYKNRLKVMHSEVNKNEQE